MKRKSQLADADLAKGCGPGADAGLEGACERAARGNFEDLVAQKNKVVDAVCRQRPCQPRTLKSARAIRYAKNAPDLRGSM